MTPRRIVEEALRFGRVPSVPFTVYDSHLPRCTTERILRNRGMCSVVRLPVFKVVMPDVKVKEEIIFKNDKRLIKTYYETPEGVLTRLEEPAGYTTWHLEKMFKSPDDYRALRFLLSNECFEPDYDSFRLAEQCFGEDGIFRASFGSEPFQSLISGLLFSTEDFCIQWMENRDEMLALYRIIVENRRKVYRIVADSPASHANYGGNVVPEIVGIENFREYYLPHYNEAAEIMHGRGKLIGSHLDANCSAFSGMIADSGLDYIEAFTPSPDTDMTIGQARAAWKDKVIWINFPSSVHLASEEVIEKTAAGLIDDAWSAEGLIMGITENVPPNRWQGNFLAIMNGLDKHAEMNPAWYEK